MHASTKGNSNGNPAGHEPADTGGDEHVARSWSHLEQTLKTAEELCEILGEEETAKAVRSVIWKWKAKVQALR